MDQKQARAAIAKVFKARGLRPRKGHLRLAVGELFWYVDVRSDGPAPGARLTFEVGCWLPELGPEPEGGAVDCPLLVDVAAGEEPVAEAESVVGLMESAGTLEELRVLVPAVPGALVDRGLRALLDGSAAR